MGRSNTVGVSNNWRIVLVFLMSPAVLAAGEPRPLPEWTPWDLDVLRRVPELKWSEENKPVKALTYRGLHYRGKPTSVFAYYASPADFGKTAGVSGSYPGMVLVHGGGGRAFERWVELWARRGYAAIAMDLAGKASGGKRRLPDGGPGQGHREKFATIDEPVENQWSYHAVANVVLAHSLLRSFEGVDADKIGLTGISWGGYLTCIAAALDSRFQFAMPVYGCGYLRDNSVWAKSEFGRMTPEQADKWHRLWDPASYLESVRIPMAFLNGTNDFAYPMDSYARSCALVRTKKTYSIQLNMRHGHIFDFKEFFVLADHFLKARPPLHIVGPPRVVGGMLRADVVSVRYVSSARLHFTTGSHENNRERAWTSRKLNLDGQGVSGLAAPGNATAWYIEVEDERGMIGSSPVTVK